MFSYFGFGESLFGFLCMLVVFDLSLASAHIIKHMPYYNTLPAGPSNHFLLTLVLLIILKILSASYNILFMCFHQSVSYVQVAPTTQGTSCLIFNLNFGCSVVCSFVSVPLLIQLNKVAENSNCCALFSIYPCLFEDLVKNEWDL